MSKKTRMFSSDVPPAEEPGTPSPRTTIVGGRPPGGALEVPPVPTGIQRLLRLAAVDEAFRAKLIERRAAVAEAAGVELTPSEVSILAAIPDDQLAQTAAQMPEPTPDRRAFLRRTAATAVVLLGGAVLSDCDSCEESDQAATEPVPERQKRDNKPRGAVVQEYDYSRPDGGVDGGRDTFAKPPPGWKEKPDAGEPPPPRPDKPAPTRGIRPTPKEEPPPRPRRRKPKRGSGIGIPEPKKKKT